MKHSDKERSVWAIALYWWTLAVIIIPNIALSITDSMPLSGRIANVLLPGGLWWIALSSSRKIGRTVLFFIILMIFAAFQIVLLYLYGRSVIAVDMFLNVVTTNPAEVGELLGNMAVAILTVIALYLPPIVAAIVACRCKWRLKESFLKRMAPTAYVCTAVGILFTAGAYFTDKNYKVENDLFPTNVAYNIKLAVERSIKTAKTDNSGYTFHAVADSADAGRKVIVVVVGETSRGDRWQLNGYSRPTNAGLDPAVFISFPRTLSESNTTHKSVPMLLSHITSETFEDSIYYVKSFISAFKEAGFRTAFFSNQKYNRSFIDRFGFEADTTIFIKEQGGYGSNPNDLELIPLLEKEIAAGNGSQLIVLHTYGSHFSYKDRYEGMEPVFLPDGPLQAERSRKKELDNAYDNSICLTSKLLAWIAEVINKQDISGAVIYTSDHGEDIFDDYRNLFLHASPVPSTYQIHVPLILWFSEAFEESYPEKVKNALANRNSNVSSSRSFSHTALDLAGITTAVSDTTLSLVRAGYKEPARLYLNDHNESVDLRRAGMRDIDFVMLDSLRIRSN